MTLPRGKAQPFSLSQLSIGGAWVTPIRGENPLHM
jgi:hypothetical protein